MNQKMLPVWGWTAQCSSTTLDQWAPPNRATMPTATATAGTAMPSATRAVRRQRWSSAGPDATYVGVLMNDSTGSKMDYYTRAAISTAVGTCEGKPTTAIRVRIPEGVIAVKPMPKAGWQLAIKKGKYAKTYGYFGTPMSEGVSTAPMGPG